MAFATALSQHPAPAEATAEVAGRVLELLDEPADLAVLFCSAEHRDSFDEIVATVRAVLDPVRLLGVTASGIIGRAREVEDGPAISLWAAGLGVEPLPVRMSAARTETGAAISGLPPTNGPDEQTLLLLSDPFTMPVADVLDVLAARDTSPAVIGGLASAALVPGGNRLALDGDVYRDGAVGILLPSSLMRPLVSQGCRPVGSPMIVTRASGERLEELAGQPALTRLQQVASELSPTDRALLAEGVHLGVVVDEHRSAFGRGDFLVRNVAGADRDTGALITGAMAPVGTTVQFHVRDASSADEDLRLALATGGDGQAALLFTCNGRGHRLFDTPDHDAGLVAGVMADETVAGMFCAGEIGPVGDRSFLHGFTASVAVFGT